MKTRTEILAALQLVMGEHPADSRRGPLDIQIVEEMCVDGLIQRKITFAPEANDRCPAWLLIPDGLTTPRPAMLCLHQTTRIGKDEPAGRGGKPNLHYALGLARRGYVTLSPDYPGFGEYRIDPYALGYASATMKGIWNHERAVDLLASLPEVDATRIGCLGHSLGGHNALCVAAFDERLRVVVTSAGFTRFTWNNDEGRGQRGDIRDWAGPAYMPRIRERYGCRAENMPFDFDDVLALIAPRPLFISAPQDDVFAAEGVRECVAAVAPLFARDRLVCRHPAGGHDFPPEVRQEAYAFIDRMLEVDHDG